MLVVQNSVKEVAAVTEGEQAHHRIQTWQTLDLLYESVASSSPLGLLFVCQPRWL